MKQKIKSICLACITLFVTYLLIVFPEQSVHASVRGLHIWWEVVFPSLLPFFIIAELLISFGIVQFIGVLFQPIMRPLFNVPGIGSFAWIIGMASGYPAGAKIATRLREKKALTRFEAERLVAFSNASSPLFIFGAIAVGFFHHPKVGILIASSHYIGNIIVGLCMRFYGGDETRVKHRKHEPNMIRSALQKMHRTRILETRPFGQVLGDAVVSSVQTLMMVGGFIMLFSVLTTLLQVIKLTNIVAFVMTPILMLLHIPDDVTIPLFTSLFEITMGIEMIASLDSIPLLTQLVCVSFVLGFNGFSVQAQVASIIAKTDIRFYPYFFARILHGICASILTFIMYALFISEETQATFSQQLSSWQVSYTYLASIGPIITLSFLFITICLLLYKLR